MLMCKILLRSFSSLFALPIVAYVDKNMRFLRYPSGKSKLLSFLADFLPESTEIQGRYFKPFIGSGSVFLHIQPERALFSDLVEELYQNLL